MYDTLIILSLSICACQYRWILAQYDVNILDYDINQVFVDSAPLNEGVDIEFDYSRKEVEVYLCCMHVRYNNSYSASTHSGCNVYSLLISICMDCGNCYIRYTNKSCIHKHVNKWDCIQHEICSLSYHNDITD